jgi:transcriptional regulator GlxA family with amidase domain
MILPALNTLSISRLLQTKHFPSQQLALHYPAVTEEDAIHVRDGRLRTAAGVTAGLD